MPLIIANSKDGQFHKDNYLDTSRKILIKKCSCEVSKFSKLPFLNQKKDVELKSKTRWVSMIVFVFSTP